MADRGAGRTAVGTAVRVALVAATAGLTLLSAFAARRAAAPRGKRPRAMRACADKPGSSREVLQLASSHVRWLAGTPPSNTHYPARPLTRAARDARAAMKRKYELSDIGKALRICIMYAASLDADAAAALLSPAQAAKDSPSRGREEGDFALRGAQRAWLTEATQRCGAPAACNQNRSRS